MSSYCHCECGLLVRLTRIDSKSEPGAALEAHGALGYAGACPACKSLCQLTLTAESPIVRPGLVGLDGGAQ